MYLKNNDGVITYPYTIGQLREDYSNVSFPRELTDSVLANFNVYRVYPIEIEKLHTKNYNEGQPTLSGSLYFQNWIVSDASDSEIADRIDQKWMEVRDIRNRLLEQSDWTQFQDSPITGSKLTEWQVYRQALRDITLQGDPFNLTWATKPT